MVAPGVCATPAAGAVAVVGVPKRPPAGAEVVVGVLTPATGVEGPVGLPKRPPGAPETAGVSAGFVAGGLPKRPPAGGVAEGVGAALKRDWVVALLDAGAAVGDAVALLGVGG